MREAEMPHVFLFAGTDDVTVARSHNQIRPLYSHFDPFALAGFSVVLRHVTNAVLATKFFGDTRKCVLQAAWR